MLNDHISAAIANKEGGDVSGLLRFDVFGMQQNGCFDALPVSKVTGRACGVASKEDQSE
ncbi:hypothetical protein ACK399_12645 [Aeromonas veronii]|uniref:hypothetical protein n=1 Tax=Aeromonas veronii TaxID=654 RepID=UPI00300772D3|nr:hypothetical protein [Aeromonas veronii]